MASAHPALGFAARDAAGQQVKATFGRAPVLMPGTPSIRAVSARLVCISGNGRNV